MNAINRRSFLKLSAGSVATAALVSGGTLSFSSLLAGCSVDAKGLLNTLLTSLENIIKVADPGAGWITSLQSAITALQGAESQWEGGSPGAIVTSALNTVEDVLAVIPLTAPFAPLIAVAVSGIEAVISALTPGSSTATANAVRANPYRGRVKLAARSLRHPSYSGAYKAQWNAVVDRNPLLAAARL